MYLRSFWEGQDSAGSELLSLPGQILIWYGSGIYIYITSSAFGHLAFPMTQQDWSLGQKATACHKEKLYFLWDKTTKGCEELLSSPGRVSVCKDKIWPDLHVGSEDPIPQFLQSFTRAEVASLD